MRGDKYYFINNKKATSADIERYIEEQIFIREFKGQLHRYLNLHRAIWGKIDAIKKQATATESEILQAMTRLERYEKTSLVIEGRLEQMSTYVEIREAGVKDDHELMDFLAVSGYRYTALTSTLTYMSSLWHTTRRYAESAQRLLARAASERSLTYLNNITILLGAVVVISVLGLLFGTGLTFGIDTLIYGAILVLAVLVGVQSWKSRRALRQYNIITDESEE